MTARRRDTRSILRWVLWLQVGFALVLFSSDLARILPQLAWPSRAPQLTDPVAPGDQTRRYRPAEVAPRPASPGTRRPVPASTEMPSRLLLEAADWDGAPSLTLTGQIAPGDAARLADYLASAPAPQTVFLNSPGGSVQDALAIGRTLRALEVDTRMSDTDICLSACPYILAAGIRRHVDDGAWVGVHQHFFGENTALPAFLAVEDIQRGQGEVMAYLDEMGIDPLLMQPALLTPPDEIYLLLPEELDRYRLVTTGPDPGDAQS